MALFDSLPLYRFDRAVERDHAVRVVGLDEAGRGPLAGPVIAAAAILDLAEPIDGINDSKKTPEKKRRALYEEITLKAVAWGVGEASPEEIDKYNILQASLLAMQRAIDGIGQAWSLALVDGNCFIPSLPQTVQKTVIKGDGLSASIAAASIIAKVTRDRIMAAYGRDYPQWDFQVHKGYPTARHRDLIGKLGLCEIHRKSFCKRFVRETTPPPKSCRGT
jgi:ribonuclease HII